MTVWEAAGEEQSRITTVDRFLRQKVPMESSYAHTRWRPCHLRDLGYIQLKQLSGSESSLIV